ncbi:hypothetical protein D3C77_407820 [compost metagenome]
MASGVTIILTTTTALTVTRVRASSRKLKPAPATIRPSGRAADPRSCSVSATPGGCGAPEKFSASPSRQASRIGLDIIARSRALGEAPRWSAPHLARTTTLRMLLTGIMAAMTTAARPTPSAPNTACTTGRKTKLFQRIMPWKTLVKAGPLKGSSGLDSRVRVETMTDTVTAAAPAAPAAEPDRSAFQIAGIRKPG